MPPRTRLTFLDDKDFDKVLSGIDKLAKAVGMTLGPRSRAVLMDRGMMWKINKDGVSVAKSIFLGDPVENAAVNVVREAAQKTVDEVGDGTTATIVLAHAIIHECLRVINNGTSPMALREGLEQGVQQITKQLDKLSTPVKTLNDKINIATISASGDKDLGTLIGTTLDEIGEEGILTIEESKNMETVIEHQEGMQLENGYSHPLFVNDPERMTAIYENVKVLVTNKNIHGIADFGPLLKKVAAETQQLVIIAPDVSTDVMEILLENKLRIPTTANPSPPFLSLVIKAPGVGDNQRDILRDICALTGAKCISAEAGDKFADQELSVLGTATRIVASKNSTVIIGNDDNKSAVDERIAMIRTQMKDEGITDFDQEKLRERLGKLTNGIAILRIGGTTEVEMKERKERALDAVNATQAAIREGIVPGGEIIYLNSREILPGNTTGTILFKALRAPFNKLLENAGYNAAEWINSLQEDGIGFDVTDGQTKSMMLAGIIDPVAVPKAALRNAVSVAIQITTLGLVITNIPEVKP